MKPIPSTSGPARQGSAPRAFTLVEIIVAMTVGMMVMGAVASILVMSLRMVNKNQEIDAAVSNTRTVQEHLTAELAKAISQNTPYVNRPVFTNGSGATPARYATMTYRIPIGSYGTVTTDTPNSSNQLVVTFPADVTPQVGDYLMMDTPNLDGPPPAAPGIRITGVSGTTPGNVTLNLTTTIAAGQDPSETATVAGAGKLARIQREREYDVVIPTDPAAVTTELHWYESTIDVGATPPKYTVLSTHVAASSPYLFAQIPLDTSPTHLASEPSVSWQFSYVATGTGAIAQGGLSNYYQTSYAEGLIFPKSGNPLSAASYLGAGPSTMGTSTTNVSSTTTMATTTMGTSTSKSSTTTLGTSTSKSSTTTLATSSSKSTTTTQGTSTSKSTTTLGTSTSKSTTTTNGTSSTTTTFGTSTSKTTTTNGTSTSKSTTTLGTSTSKSTTTLATSSSKSTTTTTNGTSTSKTTTTTLGTSTSQSSTTTLGTTTSRTTTTTTIPFDG